MRIKRDQHSLKLNDVCECFLSRYIIFCDFRGNIATLIKYPLGRFDMKPALLQHHSRRCPPTLPGDNTPGG